MQLSSCRKILVVGAGLYGATVARLLAEAGQEVEVIDKRDHIAGNAYDYINEIGVRVHKYGPHIFHTNNKRVYEWLGRFTEWIPYQHKVRAILEDGTEVVLPPNRTTADIIGEENIVDVLFRPYTKKMWGKDLEELDHSIFKRVPIRNDDNELYFPNDAYQGMPSKGYTTMVSKILDHQSIKVKLNTEFKKRMEHKFSHIFNSMPIDEYYEYRFGELPYRSIKFHHKNLPIPKVNSVPTLNFTHDGIYTRVTEWKNYPSHGENKYETTLTFEEPCDYKDNDFERYYPVKDISGENRQIYEKYQNIVNEKTTFIGRCGLYVYIDMHQAVNAAMQTASKYLESLNNG